MIYLDYNATTPIDKEVALKEGGVKELTDYFYEELKNIFGDHMKLNGDYEGRLPNTLYLSFIGYNGSELLAQLGEDFAASTGSACHSGEISISPVLKAMKVPYETAKGAVGFSLGRYTTKEELDVVIGSLTGESP